MNPFELLMKVFSRKVEKFRLWEIHFTHVYEFILVHKIHVFSFYYELGLGRAKTRPEIWPVGHGFWVARPDPGHIIEGP